MRASCGTAGTAGWCDSPPLLATFGTRDRQAENRHMAGEAVTAMIVADDAGDDPLADRREDREAAAGRERKAKVAKLNSQTANAMEVVRAQQAAKEQGGIPRLLGGRAPALHNEPGYETDILQHQRSLCQRSSHRC